MSVAPIIVTSTRVSAYEGRDGRVEAQRDIASGKLQVIDTASSYFSGARTYLRWLHERYGVTVIHPESMDETAFRYARAYNSEVSKAIEAKHGEGILDRMWREAEAYEKVHQDEAD